MGGVGFGIKVEDDPVNLIRLFANEVTINFQLNNRFSGETIIQREIKYSPDEYSKISNWEFHDHRETLIKIYLFICVQRQTELEKIFPQPVAYNLVLYELGDLDPRELVKIVYPSRSKIQVTDDSVYSLLILETEFWWEFKIELNCHLYDDLISDLPEDQIGQTLIFDLCKNNDLNDRLIQDLTFYYQRDTQIRLGSVNCCNWMIYLAQLDIGYRPYAERVHPEQLITLINWRKQLIEQKRLDPDAILCLVTNCCT